MATKQWACSDLDIKEVDYQWRITKFSYRSPKVGEALWSPAFYSDTTRSEEWKILLNLNGDSEVSKDSILFSLHLNKSNQSSTNFRCHLAVLYTSNNTKIHKRVFNQTLSPGKYCRITYLSKAVLMNDKDKCLLNDTLTLCCKLQLFQEVSCMVTPNAMNSQLKSVIDDHQLVADLEKFFNIREHSDVTIVAGNLRFPAHKTILSARSSVFAAMFSNHQMIENVNNEVIIKDIDPDTVKAMLDYIYTDKTDKSKINRLLVAADKYDLKGLKASCEMLLLDHIKVNNVCRLLIFADFFGAEELKQAAFNFICSHENDVLASPEFKSLERYPLLLRQLYETRSKVYSGNTEVD